MRPIFEEPGPRVFGLPPGADFAASLARGLRARLGDAPPEALARITVTLATGRAIRAVERAFEAGTEATFLPRLAPIAALGAGMAEAPPAIGALERRLTLTRLVSTFLAASPESGAPVAAPGLAAALADLLDEMQREEVPPARLDEAAETDPAEHWLRTLQFLAILREKWPEHLAALDLSDREALRRLDVAALLSEWAGAPPEAPLLAAGSTGSTRTTQDLLAAIARLPQGAVLLPGFDFTLDAAGWAGMNPDHPQYGAHLLLKRLGMEPTEVRRWEREAEPTARARLLSHALRPAPATDGWRAALPEIRDYAGAATEGLTLIEAESPAREAEAIALLMREALERGEPRVALTTPDIGLARRVAAELSRWGVAPDMAAGRPLGLTPAGVFARLVARLLSRPFDQAALLALLKHPLAGAGEERGALRAAVSRLELKGLRRRQVALRLRSVAAVAAEMVKEGEGEAPLAAPALLPVLAALEPMPEAAPLSALVARHRVAAEAIAGAALFERADGAALLAAFERFGAAAPALGPEARAAEYADLFEAALDDAGEVRDPAAGADARIVIEGQREARIGGAGLVILGGLNEGTWPAAPPVDPWLSRPMRARIGLPPPERRIGLSAHDFLSAAAAPRAVLSRAGKAEGAPTTPSRWLSRLVALLSAVEGGAPLAAMRARGAAALARADALRRAPPPPAAKRPAPNPPAEARPRKLSVTEVEALIRDPYAIYARHVLKLRPLDPLGAAADARDRGEVLHLAVERFVEETMGRWPGREAAGPLFDRIAAEAVSASVGAPSQALAWEMRLARLRDWFLAEEEARRAEGRPAALEASGVLEFVTRGGDFTLRGRADRVDALEEGGLAIYDYKSGATPSKEQARIFQKQLPLLALIAEAAGLEGAPRAAARRLAYIALSGAGEGGKTVEIEPEADALARLVALIEAFETDRPYIPRAYPEESGFASDYDHLSRFGEWSDRVAEEAPPGAPEPGP
ncbi:MAG: double-strand break repair protein AddB [Pikeienuella sp.]|uniref:double-strand break repair protein AddB n=1 Tax=Pikeienuella sp. TaxID=2831957 RepID=UPI00391D604C